MKKAQAEFVANAIIAECNSFWFDIGPDRAMRLAEVVEKAIKDSSLEARERAELRRLQKKYQE